MEVLIFDATFEISAHRITVEVADSDEARFKKYRIMAGNVVLVLDGEIGAIFSEGDRQMNALPGLQTKVTCFVNGRQAKSNKLIPITELSISRVQISKRNGRYRLDFQSN